VGAADDPDVVGKRLQDVVRVAEQKVLGGAAVVMRVTDGVDLVGVCGHRV
jgi:hypothetical protein